MIFSRIGRSLARSLRSSKGVSINGRSEFLIESLHRRVDGNSGVFRAYLAAIEANNTSFDSKVRVSDFNYLVANPRLRRFFSTGESPKKKNYENFYPRDKKEIPKGDEQKSQSKEDRNADDSGNYQTDFMKQIQNLIIPLLAIWLFLSSFPFGSRKEKEISFQEFKNKLLEPGLVDHIVVTNKSVAKVYVRNSPLNQSRSDGLQDSAQGPGANERGKKGQYKYYFNIGSVESFEEKLEEAQEALGIDHHDYVPVTYDSEIGFSQVMKFAPTLLLLGTLLYMGRKLQSGLGGVGGGGKGARGIFSIGKAPINKVDKNAKNKVFF